MRLVAVVVTFNRKAALARALPQLLAEPIDRIVLVDNASTDGTAAWLAELSDPRLHVVTLPENTGGAGGFETGMRVAGDDSDPPDWILLLDDDAWPEAGAIGRFRAETAGLDTEIGAVAAAVRYPDGSLCEMNRPSRNPFWHPRLFLRTLWTGNRAGFHLPDAAFAPDAGVASIDVASFVGFFVRRQAVERIGLPEGGLFIYGDDVLYSLRLRRAGFRMVLIPAVRFVHDCATLDAGFVYRPLWKIYYHCRNGVSIARQAAGPVVFPAALAYYTLLWWRRGRSCRGEERRRYYAMMRAGLRDGLLRRRGRNDAIHALAVAEPARAG